MVLPSPVPDPSSPPHGRPRGRTALLRTTPMRIRALTIAAILAMAGLFAVTAVTFQNARDGMQVIGHDAGPQVVATSDLYFALSDMDAQIANALLIGPERDLSGARQAALDRYEQRRSEANRAILQAAKLAGEDATEQRTVQAVLDGLGQYERLAGQAVLLDTESRHAPGPPPQKVTSVYREATDLMKLDLLPKAYNLTLDSGTTVRHSYEDQHAAISSGQGWVLLNGLVVILILAGLQGYLAARFRRLISPAIALAALGTCALVIASVALLSAEGRQMTKVKERGFDSVLALSRARAISNSAYADESRYLLDPGRADTYEQVYLEKSQALLFVPAGSLDTYYRVLDDALDRRGGSRKADFLGFYGEAARGVSLPGERRAVDDLLLSYLSFQRSDRRMRELVSDGKRRDAIEIRTGGVPGGEDFERYDEALTALIALHRDAFSSAVSDADHRLRRWDLVLPCSVILIAALVVAGVRPRLAEFR
ncbi:hypothetical protein HKK72_23450 [Actinomadura sp. HBU206391]|nr:hypothetical protein [Actinomadura sp. HBU206391]